MIRSAAWSRIKPNNINTVASRLLSFSSCFKMNQLLQRNNGSAYIYVMMSMSNFYAFSGVKNSQQLLKKYEKIK